MLVAFRNPSIENNATTDLKLKIAAGETTLTTRDNTGFSANDYIILGQYGQENAELVKISAVNDIDTITLTAGCSFNHAQGDPLTVIYFNQIEIEYKTSANGASTAIAGMPVALQVDREGTLYKHSTGTTAYYYKSRYYNSTTAQYSDWSVWFPAAGFSRRSVHEMLNSVFRLSHDKGENLADRDEVVAMFNDCQDEVAALNDKWFFLKVDDSTTLTTTASTARYALPTDFQRLEALRYHADDGTNEYIYRLRYKPEVEFDALVSDQGATDSDDMTCFTLRAGDSTAPQGYFEVYPTPVTGSLSFEIVYYKQMAELSEMDDITDIPLPRVLVYYAVAEMFRLRRKFNEAGEYDKLYERQLNALKRLQKRNIGQPEFLAIRGGRRRMMGFYDGRVATDIDTLREDYW